MDTYIKDAWRFLPQWVRVSAYAAFCVVTGLTYIIVQDFSRSFGIEVEILIDSALVLYLIAFALLTALLIAFLYNLYHRRYGHVIEQSVVIGANSIIHYLDDGEAIGFLLYKPINRRCITCGSYLCMMLFEYLKGRMITAGSEPVCTTCLARKAQADRVSQTAIAYAQQLAAIKDESHAA